MIKVYVRFLKIDSCLSWELPLKRSKACRSFEYLIEVNRQLLFINIKI